MTSSQSIQNFHFSGGTFIDIGGTFNEVNLEQSAKEIYKWLSPPDSTKNYQEALQNRQEGTCSWFLRGERFTEWEATPDVLLWIKGIAGSGKSVLCSSVIEKIHNSPVPGPRQAALASFFFDGRNAQKAQQTHDNLVRSLIWQFSRQCDKIPDVLVNAYRRGHPSINSLEDTLHSILDDGFDNVFIVIDALDECTPSERRKVLDWITTISSLKAGKLHIMLASRPERDISDAFQALDACSVDVATESSNHDIETYLIHELDKPRFSKWTEQTRAEIKSKLKDGAQGMFRWVALQLSELKKCPNLRRLQKQLNALPKTLNETYDRILARLDESDRSDVRTFLCWFAFSTRPMTLEEMAETVAVDFDSGDVPVYTPDGRYPDPKDVMEKCSGLIVESKGNVQLAHFTIKEYLLSEDISPTAKYFALRAPDSHLLMSQTCLAYLLQFDTDFDCFPTMSPLVRYAARNWIFHVQSSNTDEADSHPTLTMILNLFQPCSAFTNWARVRQNRFYRNLAGKEEISSPLCYAAQEGLEGVVHHLLERGADANAQGGEHVNALQAASSEGYGTIVKLLLEKGADLNAQGGEYGNALQAASSEGYGTIVKLLLEKGADLNAQGGEYGNALQAASYGGHDAIVRLLLEKGVDPNAQGGRYGNALQAASAGGHDVIVRLLLEKGVDPNAQGGFYGNVLQAASFGAYDAIVKLLLEKGVDPNAQGGYYGNALQAASFGGHEVIVRLLLEKGVDPNAQGGLCGNAVQAAASQGHDAIVGLLLEKGVDPNVQGGFYGNVLQAASAGGHDTIVKLLLEKGVDLNAQGGYLGNALQAASYGGHDTIVKLLLEKGVDPNAQGGEYGNALQAASFEGQNAIVKLLLEKGVDPNAQGGYFGNALQAAAHGGHHTIVKLLLKQGADVNVQGGRYGNALQAASSGGRNTIMKLLLENGADWDAQ